MLENVRFFFSLFFFSRQINTVICYLSDSLTLRKNLPLMLTISEHYNGGNASTAAGWA